MNMSTNTHNNTGRINVAVLLLIAAVALPSCCLLWFMNQAVQSERLAVRQRLIDTYRQSCDSLIEKSNRDWQQNIEHIKSLTDTSQQELIDFLLGSIEDGKPQRGFASGLVLYDNAGKIVWPSENIPDDLPQVDEEIFKTAYKFEFEQKNYTAAMKEYAGIVILSDNAEIKKHALIGQARCLQQSGLNEKAIEMCRQAIAISHDSDIEPKIFLGRLLALANSDQAREYINGLLTQGLSKDNKLTISQNILLLKEAIGMVGKNYSRELLITAEEFLDALEISSFAQKENFSKLVEHSVMPIYSELWGLKITSEKGNTAIIFFDEYKIAYQTIVRKYMKDLPPDIFCKLYDNNGKYITFGLKNIVVTDGSMLYGIPDDDGVKLFEIKNPMELAGWRIDVFLMDGYMFDTAAKQRTALYFYLGFFTIITFVILGTAAIMVINKQIRINRLKNDFISTVTHELKTPLASTRMLVDTILEGRVKDEATKHEYLEIISHENIRLTRLIDNFLAFSRMERSKNAFVLRQAEPAQIAHCAIEAMKTKIEKSGCGLEILINENLPAINVDFDAMVTVLTNLLDNACKYSNDGDVKKYISLNVYAENNEVCFEVKDNGIGLTPKQMKKIFNRFYQADQRLDRKAEGCGLGLSIVKFIVDSHGGKINVESKPGIGSCFTVRMK